MRDLIMSLAASVIAGSAVWFGQRLLRYRRMARMRAFFGVWPAAGALLVAPRHFSSPRTASVHRQDMAALVELATVVNACGGRAELVDEQARPHGIGRVTEFCVGGPASNPRTGAHLRSLLPGVRFDPYALVGGELTLSVGGVAYRRSPEHVEYAILARLTVPAMAKPVFLIAGQTARTNLAAARLLASQYRRLLRTYRTSGRFCLVLRIVEPDAYGPDLVEIVADVTGEAFQPPEPAAAVAPGAAAVPEPALAGTPEPDPGPEPEAGREPGGEPEAGREPAKEPTP